MRWPRLAGALEGNLAARASAGDATAFRQIYDQHAPAIYRFLCDLLGDASSADEATQETFVRAHSHLGSIRDEGKLSSWLFGIARNVSLETLRRRKRLVPLPDVPLADESGEPPEDPESALLLREADEVLGRALSRLSEERRAALLLVMDHGLPYAEIAEIMGWSLAKVKIEIHRARQILRAQLTQYLELEKVKS